MKIIKLAFLVICTILSHINCIGLNSNYQLLLNLAKKHKIHKTEPEKIESVDNSKKETTLEKKEPQVDDSKKENSQPKNILNNLNSRKLLYLLL